jgi:hypothetical protein
MGLEMNNAKAKAIKPPACMEVVDADGQSLKKY